MSRTMTLEALEYEQACRESAKRVAEAYAVPRWLMLLEIGFPLTVVALCLLGIL